jgi:hypothetical protein
MQTEEQAVYDAFESGYFAMRYPTAVTLDPVSRTGVSAVKPSHVGFNGLPGDVSLAPTFTKKPVPLDATYQLELPPITLALDQPQMNIELTLDMFEISVLGRWVAVMGAGAIHFETDASIAATGPLLEGPRVFIPIGPLGAGIKTPAGTLAIGLVVELVVKIDGTISLGWHQVIQSQFNMTLIQCDPLAPSFVKQWLGYPKDVVSVSGPAPTFEISGAKIEGEVTAKLFAAPQIVLALGNAAGVMKRAKKDEAKYGTECKKFKGVRVAAGFEANVSATGTFTVGDDGTSLCFDAGRDAKVFADLFPGFGFCPSVEYSLLDEATKVIAHQCWCQTKVNEVVMSVGNHVGDPVTFDVKGFCFKPGTTEDAITVTLPGCNGMVTTAYTDTVVSYRCVPNVSGVLYGMVKDAKGNDLFDFAAQVLPSDPLTPIVTSVSPLSVTQGVMQAFVVQGSYLPISLAFWVDGCTNYSSGTNDGQTARFNCTPQSTGVRAGVVKAQAGDSTSLKDFTVQVNAATCTGSNTKPCGNCGTQTGTCAGPTGPRAPARASAHRERRRAAPVGHKRARASAPGGPALRQQQAWYRSPGEQRPLARTTTATTRRIP